MANQEKLEVFDSFRKGMISYLSGLEDDGIKRKKSACTHRIALALERTFPSDVMIDIDTLGADLLVWDGKAKIHLALFWSEDYLTEKERERAYAFHLSQNPSLTLAFSVLPGKDWLLVYRFEKSFLEYLHIDKATFEETPLRQKSAGAEDEGQMFLRLPQKRRRLSASSPSQDL